MSNYAQCWWPPSLVKARFCSQLFDEREPKGRSKRENILVGMVCTTVSVCGFFHPFGNLVPGVFMSDVVYKVKRIDGIHHGKSLSFNFELVSSPLNVLKFSVPATGWTSFSYELTM